MTTDDRSHASLARPFAGLADGWLRATDEFVSGVIDANRRLLTQYGVAEDVSAPPTIPSIYYTEGEWSFERSVDTPDHVSVGDTVRFTKRITDEDVRAFAEVSGDTNRLHLDDEFAEETRFGRRVVHGTLLSGVISAALARLPGLVVYLAQDVRFLDPVDVDTEVTAEVTVAEDLGERRYELTTDVYDEDEQLVIDGEAVVVIDDLPSAGEGEFGVQ